MAGLTLDIFESAAGVFRGARTGGVAGQAGRVGGFIFFDQRLVGPGVRGGCPVLVLAGMTGLAPLFPDEGKERRDTRFQGRRVGPLASSARLPEAAGRIPIDP